MNSKIEQPNQSRKRLIIWCLLGVALVILGFFVYNFLSPRNYAAEVARPIEEGLIKAGAVKVCADGDSGRGIDNRVPHYGSTFEMHASRDVAVAIMQRVATDTGYHITHASTENRGPF